MNANQPHLSQSQAKELVARLYGLTVSEMGDLPSYVDQNFRVVDQDGSKYVLKIINSAGSQNPALLEVQTHAMGFLQQHGLPTQTALPTTMGQLMSLEEIDCGFGCQTYCVRLLTYMSGTTLSRIPVSPQILYEVGRLGATVDKVLQQMTSPHLGVLQQDEMFWSLANVHLLEPYVHVLDGEPLQEVVKAIIKQYLTCVQPKLSSFQKGVIHGDLSDQNIVAQPTLSGGYEVSGILDFGLLTVDCYVFEVAVSIMYLMLENARPLEVGGAVLSGWESVWPLEEAERDCLYILVLCRMCQSLVMGRYNASIYPDNKEYFLTTSRSVTRLLHELWGLGKQEVERKWFRDAKAYNPGSLVNGS